MNLEETLRERTIRKSAVTRRCTYIRRFMAEDDHEKVEQKVGELKEAFSAFDEINEHLTSLLEKPIDIEANEELYDGVQDSYVATLNEVRAYQKSSVVAETVTSPKLSPLSLPPAPQPQVFDGDPERFPMWHAAFSTLIDRPDLQLSGEQKMFYLQQYISGDASSAIKSLFLIPSDSSYNSAMGILKERFGTPNKVCAAFRRKLESWPKINSKDPKSLLSFSDFLQQVVVASEKYKSLDILNDEFENHKLVAKLPHAVSSRWVDKVVASDPVFPSFKEFASFVASRAKVLNHSLWNTDAAAKDKAKSFSTSSANLDSNSCPDKVKDVPSNSRGSMPKFSSFSCPICGDNHATDKCVKFARMNLSDRKAAIMRHRLCFGCLSKGHQNSTCRIKHTCNVCGLRHPTLLHDHSKVTLCSSSSISVSESSACSTMVVPVRVCNGDRSRIVYALLDSQSNSHFVSKKSHFLRSLRPWS